MKVFLNPGHDIEYDSGAVNPNNGTREADVAARVGERVKGYLEAAGCEVMLLQSDNLYWDSKYPDRNQAVVPTANNWMADVFVSIHCNACSGTARGTETWTYGSRDGRELAECIQNQLINSIDTIDRGVKTTSKFLVLRSTDMPAALVEMAFIDNDDDCRLLLEQEDEFARAIARGVTDYQLQEGIA